MPSATPRWLRVAENLIRDANTYPGRDVTNYISLDSLHALRGMVPLSLLMERLWRDNCPECSEFDLLSPGVRMVSDLGYVGGVAELPVSYARDVMRFDPRDPWTSTLMLATRLRDIAESRARQYSDMWTRFNCREWTDQEKTALLPAALGYGSDDFEQVVGKILALRNSVGWRAISQSAISFRGTVSGAPVSIPNLLCLDGAVPPNTGVPGCHAVLRMAAAAEQYFGVSNDLGFWRAIFLEERVVAPFRALESSRKDVMNRLWTEFLRSGLAAFLMGREGGAEVFASLWLFGLVWTVDVFAWMRGIVENYNSLEPDVRDRLQLAPEDITMLRGHMAAIDGIAGGATFNGEQPTWSACPYDCQSRIMGPDECMQSDVAACSCSPGTLGANTWTQPDWVGPDSWNPGAVPIAQLRLTAIPWSQDTDRWAGALFQTPPQVEPPRPRPQPTPTPTPTPSGTKPPTVVAKGVHPIVPLLIGAAVPVVGFLIVRNAGKQ
jgi:hypothetical protein